MRAALAALLLMLPACGGGGQYGAWDQAPSRASGGAYVQTAAAAEAPPPAQPSPGYGGDEGGIQLQTELADMQRQLAEADGAAPPAQPRYAQNDAEGSEERTATDAREGPLLIYTANVALAVHQVSEKQGQIEAMARDVGGHLHRRTDAEIVIRVPAETFQQVLAAILELGDVLHRDVSVQDVSEEFHDVQTRIRTLESMYARVEQLLANAQDIEHALAVEQHLERITLQLEQLRGRLRFLADRVAFSTITVRFTEQATVEEPRFELPFRWLRDLGIQNLLRLRR